jgi:TrmH family RNA methyltransferase
MISKATISFVQSLKQKKYRQKYNKFLLEGEKIILEGLEEGLISFDSIFCLPEKEYLLQDIKTNYNIINSKTLKSISNLSTPPGILAIANIPKQKEVNNLDFRGLSLFLEDIKDPGNMGTIIRTADWFGVQNLIASPESVEFYNPKVLQSTMGSFSRINLINLPSNELPAGIPIYSTTLSGSSIYEFTPPKSMILVIGSESHGVSPEILKASAGSITIPRNPNAKAESLNAGIATAILLSHLC